MGGGKRPDRHKRKEPTARRRSALEPDLDVQPGPSNGDSPARIEQVVEANQLSRSELKNQAARDALVPLREGERPLAVTIGAITSTVLFLAAVAGWLLWDVLRDDTRPAVISLLLFAGVVGAMAYGMWRVRYWAVLGFQAVLLFSILGSGLGAVQATRILLALGNVVVLAAAATLFFFMVKALARIQMLERGPR